MFTILSGGTGSAKFIRGLVQVVPQKNVAVIVNIGDNLTLHGFYICPDIDSIVYALAGILDVKRGWGVAQDTFNFLSMMTRLKQSTWFKLGDRDLAVHVLRTMRMNSGATLSAVTREIASMLNVEVHVMPATNSRLETYVETPEGKLHLQEFWVKLGGNPTVNGVAYRGNRRAKAAPGVLSAIERADAVIIAPANPVTSIGPILAVREIRRALHNARRRIAISPIIGQQPVSGPAGKFMKALHVDVSPVGVAQMYRGLIDVFIIHNSDAQFIPAINKLGIRCVACDILMPDAQAEVRLAEAVKRIIDLE